MFVVFSAIWIMLFGTMINLVRSGEWVRYYADEREFKIMKYLKNGTEILDYVFRYEAVAAVRYEPLRWLWKDRGYKVFILYRGKEYRIDYLHPQKGGRDTTDTPFYIIEENMTKGVTPDGWTTNS